MSASLSAGLVGCGLIGRKRSQAMPGAQLVACADMVASRAEEIAARVQGCKAYADWREMLATAPCDIVIIATLHDSLAARLDRLSPIKETAHVVQSRTWRATASA